MGGGYLYAPVDAMWWLVSSFWSSRFITKNSPPLSETEMWSSERRVFRSLRPLASLGLRLKGTFECWNNSKTKLLSCFRCLPLSSMSALLTGGAFAKVSETDNPVWDVDRVLNRMLSVWGVLPTSFGRHRLLSQFWHWTSASHQLPGLTQISVQVPVTGVPLVIVQPVKGLPSPPGSAAG